MRLYKRGKYWWASWTEEGRTVRRSTRANDREAAKLVAARWQRERADPDHAAAEAATLGDAVKHFLATHTRGKAAGTATMYRQKCGHLVRLLGADRKLATINARVVDEYIDARRKEPVAFDANGEPTRFVVSNTIHKELVALRGVLKYAKRRGEYQRDPKAVLPIGFATEYEPRKRTLTIEQAGKLCAELPPHRAAVVAFILGTSARKSEVLNQTRARVALERGFVHLKGTKTEGADRIVPALPFVRPLLEFALANGTGKGERLFAPWPSMRRDILRACARAGVPEVTPNDLRRSLATWLVERGVPNHVVAKILGHADTKMVDRVYGRASDAAVAQLATQYLAGAADQSIARVPLAYQSAPESAESEDGTEGVDTENPRPITDSSALVVADRTIKSPQLYRLSYRPELAKNEAEGGAAEAAEPPSVPSAYQEIASTGGEYDAGAVAASAASIGLRSVRLEVDGRTVARSDAVDGDTTADVVERLAAGASKRGPIVAKVRGRALHVLARAAGSSR